MKKILLAILFLGPAIVNAQVLGGYTLYSSLATAVHPNHCYDAHVTGFPNDSVWVNFDDNDSMSGTFSRLSVNGAGDDLLLETGFNTSNYGVSLLLSNGTYSAVHTVNLADWALQPNFAHWRYLYTDCNGDSQASAQYIVPLDFSQDFGLTSSDTVTGIKIVFLPTFAAADFAGAYITTPNLVGVHEPAAEAKPSIYPNPFSETINLRGTEGAAEINIYDVHSRKLLQEQFINSISMSTERLSKGIYFYEVRKDNAVTVRGRIVKE